jgi:predicted kinase
MSYLVIIRGPLGIGKSTIAKKLAEEIKGDYISIDDILADNNLDQVDEKEGCISLKNFLKVNEIILPRINQSIQKNVSVVVDGNFYHKDQIDDLVKNFPANNYVFTLTAPLEVCLERDSQRQKSYGKDATTAVYSLVSKFEYGKVIDVSTLTAEEATKQIISNLAKT